MGVIRDKQIVIDYDCDRMTISEVWEGLVTYPTCECDDSQPMTATVSFVTYDGPIPPRNPNTPETAPT